MAGGSKSKSTSKGASTGKGKSESKSKYNANTPLQMWRRYHWRRVPHFSRPKPEHDWHWRVALVGKSLITLGLLMFLFVGYQLWGTGIRTAQAQDRLENEFQEKLEATTTTATPSTTTTTTTTTTVTHATFVPIETTTTDSTVPVAAPSEPLSNGDPVAIIRIPKIHLKWQVVEGVTVADLQDGPGHFPETPMPGQLGNAAIAGHRTTHGHPFLELDELEVGDLIELTTLVGKYTYEVTDTLIVKPSAYGAVIPTIDPTVATLVLATCDPVYTATNRLIVRATLVADKSDQVFAPPTTTSPPTTTVETIPGDEPATTDIGDTTTSVSVTPDPFSPSSQADDAFSNGWFSDSAAIPHVLSWGVLLFAVGFGAYFVGRAARRLYVSFLVGFVPFIFVLYFWFENINRLLPPGL